MASGLKTGQKLGGTDQFKLAHRGLLPGCRVFSDATQPSCDAIVPSAPDAIAAWAIY